MWKVRFFGFVCGLTLVGAALARPASDLAEPKITSVKIDGTNVVVKVSAPAGLRKVTLETRSRLEGSTWAPKALQRFENGTANAQELTFVLPRSASLEVLRVRADTTDSLPATFFKGTNQFAGPQSINATPTGVGVNDTANPNGAFPGSAPPEQRSVVESDIWKIAGDTLYFFNNLRGLQVINIANPAAPVLKVTFSVPASGEQMYVLPSGHAVLLTRNWCGDTSSKILIVDGAAATPTFASQIAVEGYLSESRMVGNALYVISQFYEQHPIPGGGTTWEPVMILTSIDLSNPSAPVKRGSQTLPGYPNTIHATDRYLLTVGWNSYYTGSDLQLVDISSPTGEFTVLSTIHATGAVADKFKLNISGDTLTIISHTWNVSDRWTTTLENFSIANPRAPVKVGSLRLAQGEQLHATRFDGNRVYIVTFLRIDPLWIVDLTDAAHPKIAGELHVPGWSTYLQPLGDRVVALGIDNTNSWRVAVSLFDVSNAADPKLLSKVALGENSSWSEANYDEKALTVLPDDGLILVPFSGYTTNGQASHVQLIDLGRDLLTARGLISDHLYPRRATLHRDHIVSISGREFITYDASNRDQPVLKASIDLAWPVNKVFLSGDYLLELETGSSYGGYYYYYGWSSSPPATIRVARADHPETVLSSITLTNGLQITGSEVRGNKLYVTQGQSGYYYPWILMAAPDASGNADTNPPAPATLTFSVWDLAQLPSISKMSEIKPPIGDQFGGALTPVWPKPNLLVWYGGAQLNWGWWAIDVAVPSVMAPIGIFPGPWRGWGGGGSLAAFDVSDAANPNLKSVVQVATNSWNFSNPFVAEGLVYLSHQTTEIISVPIDPPPTDPPIDPSKTNATTSGWGNGTNVIRFVTRWFLDVIDYADAANPVVRKPVNVPGALQGATHQGGVIYTTGAHFNMDGNSDGAEFLDASAYDGVAAFLIDSMSLTNWPRPIVVNGPDIFLGRPTSLERWRLNDDGMFAKLSTTDTKEPVYNLRFFGDLAALLTQSRVRLYDATDRGAFKAASDSGMACNASMDLENADGSLERGLFVPLSDYGVMFVPASAGQ